MGSEMCIRDRLSYESSDIGNSRFDRCVLGLTPAVSRGGAHHYTCLLYTSDAADERSSVDLGGRRIIKKKTTNRYSRIDNEYIQNKNNTYIEPETMNKAT